MQQSYILKIVGSVPNCDYFSCIFHMCLLKSSTVVLNELSACWLNKPYVKNTILLSWTKINAIETSDGNVVKCCVKVSKCTAVTLLGLSYSVKRITIVNAFFIVMTQIF